MERFNHLKQEARRPSNRLQSCDMTTVFSAKRTLRILCSLLLAFGLACAWRAGRAGLAYAGDGGNAPADAQRIRRRSASNIVFGSVRVNLFCRRMPQPTPASSSTRRAFQRRSTVVIATRPRTPSGANRPTPTPSALPGTSRTPTCSRPRKALSTPATVKAATIHRLVSAR